MSAVDFFFMAVNQSTDNSALSFAYGFITPLRTVDNLETLAADLRE